MKEINNFDFENFEATVKNTQIEECTDSKKVETMETKLRVLSVTIVALLIFLILFALRSCSLADNSYTPTMKPVVELEDSVFVTKEAVKSEHIAVPILGAFTVTADDPYCTLSNPEANADSFYLQYVFYIEGTDTPFYESKMVEAGKVFSADIYNALEGKAGIYDCTVKVNTFAVDTLAEKNGVQNKVTITVE